MFSFLSFFSEVLATMMNQLKHSWWSWFCGRTNSSLSYHMTTDTKKFECVINADTVLLHLLFIITAFLILLLSRCCCVNYRKPSQLTPRWPGHIYRWIMAISLLLCALASIAEGILTEMARNEGGNPQLQFYLPGCMLVIAIAASLMYYQFAERWQAPRMNWLLLMYWLFCIIMNVWRICILIGEHKLPGGPGVLDTAVFWITVVKTAFFALLLMLELYLVSFKGCIYFI